MPGRHGRLARLAACLVLGAGGLAGCSDLASTRDIRVTLVDEDTAPVPGAVFYAEASDATGPFAYLWRISGRAGEVPDSAREPLKIPWRPGARLAMAAFAPGRTPVVMRDGDDAPVRSDGAVFALRPGGAWNPALATLAFPFEGAPDLAARLDDAAQAPLLDAFRRAWAAAPAAELDPSSRKKHDVLTNPGQDPGRSGRSLGQ